MDFKSNPLSCHGLKGHHLASHCFCTVILLMIPEQAKHVSIAALFPLSGLLRPCLCKWSSVQKSPSQRGLPQWPNQMFILLLNSLFYFFLAHYHHQAKSPSMFAYVLIIRLLLPTRMWASGERELVHKSVSGTRVVPDTDRTSWITKWINAFHPFKPSPVPTSLPRGNRWCGVISRSCLKSSCPPLLWRSYQAEGQIVGDSEGQDSEGLGFDGERRSRTAGWWVMKPWRHSLGSRGDLRVTG